MTRFAYPATRREFLQLSAKGIGLLAFARYAPAFLTSTALAGHPAPEKDRSILVLIQLAGGNDGLNTVIPYQDDRYYRLRPQIGIQKDDTLDLNGQLGLHSSCRELKALLDQGQLSIVQNVGYPNPNRSHFRSMEIWETASESDQFLSTGWLGRYFDNACEGAPADQGPVAVHASGEVPQAFMASQPHATFGLRGGGGNARRRNLDLLQDLAQAGPEEEHGNGAFLRHTLMNALVTERRIQEIAARDRPQATYPGNQLGQSLRSVAALIAAQLPTRVYFVSLGGFDTHRGQANAHANLLRTLSGAMAAFQQDLNARGLADQVLTATFSEFGRRPKENDSQGTDHGTAAPLFLMGNKLKGGLHGTAPDLGIGPNEDLRYSTDFRQVYATLLGKWLGAPAEQILGRTFDPLEVLA
jgi:uncharacterized protein (DUF1501 family)